MTTNNGIVLVETKGERLAVQDLFLDVIPDQALELGLRGRTHARLAPGLRHALDLPGANDDLVGLDFGSVTDQRKQPEYPGPQDQEMYERFAYECF